MNKTIAERILGISDENIITIDLIKKSYRRKAKENHPDKFQTESGKLKATKLFIKLKEAHDFLINYINVNGSYEKSSYTTSSGYTDPVYQDEPQNNQEADYGMDKMESKWLSYFIALLFPGIFISGGFLLLIHMIHEEFKEELGIMGIIIVAYQIILLGIGILALPYFIAEWAIEGSIIAQIILTQFILSLGYYGYCYLYRKYLENKYLKNTPMAK